MAATTALRIPVLERMALFELAYRRGESEDETLRRLIREAVLTELTSREDNGAALPAGNNGGETLGAIRQGLAVA